jgi:hypothetical protein
MAVYIDDSNDDDDGDGVMELPRMRRGFTIPTTLQFFVVGFFGGVVVRVVEIVACCMIAAGWGHSSHAAYGVLLVSSQLSIAVNLPMLIGTVQMIRSKHAVRRHWKKKMCHVRRDEEGDGSHFSGTWTEPCTFYCILSFLYGMIIGSYLTWAAADVILGDGQPTRSSGSFLASCVVDLMMLSVLVWLYQLDRPKSTNPEILYSEQEQATVLIV